MSSLGEQAKYILETTFDTVANGYVTCVISDSVSHEYKAIIHDEIVRARREHLSAGNEEGLSDKQSKRVILLTRDIIASGTPIDASYYFLINGVRFDFSVSEPFCDVDTTPFAGANQVFSIYYVRRAEELESQIAPVEGGTGAFSFNNWKLS
jgi:hypothetical protein